MRSTIHTFLLLIAIFWCSNAFSQDATFTFQISSLQTYAVTFETTYDMLDTATYTFEWDFGDGNTGNYPKIIHKYSAAGTYSVTLTVQNISTLASDVSSQSVTVGDVFNVPNVFSPDGDGINDLFIAQSNGVTPLTITIFNRAGSVVYKQTAPTIAWDGRSPSGDMVKPGVYYYVITADEEIYNKTGFFHLFYGKDSR
jgi:gliding motility-associated-like protein